MKRTPELRAIREEIDSVLKARVQIPADESLQPPADEGPQPPADESPQSPADESLQPPADEGLSSMATEQAEAEQAIRSVNDLAAAHGIESEQMYGLMMKLGTDREIPLGEVKDRLMQLDAERQQIEQQRAQLAQQAQEMQARMAQADQMQAQLTERQMRARQALAAIEGQYRNKVEDWSKRRDIEPGKVALEQQEMSAAIYAAQQELQMAKFEADKQQSIAHQQWLVQQDYELSNPGSPFHIPDWAIPEKKQSLAQDIKQLAMSRYRATPEEIKRFDARTILLLKDAMEGIKAKEAAERAMADLTSKPPVIPRSARQSAVAQQRENVAELEKLALKTGKTQDKLAAARAILGNK